jgi:hypothetical protein
VGDQQPGHEVILDNVRSTIEGGGISNAPDHERNADVGHDDCIALSLREENRVGIKVIGPFGVIFLSRNVEP